MRAPGESRCTLPGCCCCCHYTTPRGRTTPVYGSCAGMWLSVSTTGALGMSSTSRRMSWAIGMIRFAEIRKYNSKRWLSRCARRRDCKHAAWISFLDLKLTWCPKTNDILTRLFVKPIVRKLGTGKIPPPSSEKVIFGFFSAWRLNSG